MPNTDMKLLMETWRKYSDTIENTDQFGSIYLFENKTAVKKDFESLLQEFDSGKITENELYECWNKSMLYEQKLLNEIDWKKEGELVQQPGYKPPHERRGMLDVAMQKAQDWVLEKSVQIYQMAKRGLMVTVQALSGLVKAAKRFQEKYPVATKIIVVIALSLAMFALMSALDSSEAQAAIRAPGLEGGMGGGEAGEISDASYEALRGMIHQTKEADLGGTSLELRAEAMKIVDVAQAAGKTVDLSTIQGEYGEFANEQVQALDGLVKLAREGDPEAFEWLKKLTEVGKDAVYKVMGRPTRPIPGG